MQDFHNDMWKRHLETQEAFRSHAPEFSQAVQGESEQLRESTFHEKIRQEITPILKQLAEISRTGNATKTKHETNSALALAAQTGHLKAVKALVAHGADVNATLHDNRDELTALTPILSGCFINGRQIPWKERKGTVEFLLSQGAELNPEGEAVLIALQLSLLVGHETEPWHWALDHGRQVTPACLDSMMTCPGGYSLAERVIREKRVDVNDDGGYRTPLQALIYAVTCCDYADELQELEAERKLALLLTAGARVEDLNIATLRRRLNEPDLPAEVAEILTRMLNKLQHSNYHD